MAKSMHMEPDGDEPKNPFEGILGKGEPDGDEDMEEESDDHYDVSPEVVDAAGEVLRAVKKGSADELARALCALIDLKE